MIVGTCSICGGRVSVPDSWLSVVAPTPTCEQCGAVKASHGPVIDMVQGRPYQSITTNKVMVDGVPLGSSVYIKNQPGYVDHIRHISRPPKRS